MPTRIEGEAAQLKGAEGAMRAKKWLEGTSRASVPFVNPYRGASEKCGGRWPHGGQSFSFDLLGMLKNVDDGSQFFFVEVKNYNSLGDLGSLYKEYLAKCYVMIEQKSALSDHFMWISWHPHDVTNWSNLCSADWVKRSVLEHKARIFGETVSQSDADGMVDLERCQKVAERLWLIILSERQEQLTLSLEHLGIINKFEIENGRGT